MTMTSGRHLGFKILCACVCNANASDESKTPPQQRSRLKWWIALCIAMFLTKILCMSVWRLLSLLVTSLATAVRAILQCSEHCLVSRAITVCRKPASIPCGSCIMCFAFSLHVSGRLDHVLPLACGLARLLMTCFNACLQSMKTMTCINHPIMTGAWSLASAGHLTTACIRFLYKRKACRRQIIARRKVQTRRCRQSHRMIYRVQCGLCRCTVATSQLTMPICEVAPEEAHRKQPREKDLKENYSKDFSTCWNLLGMHLQTPSQITIKVCFLPSKPLCNVLRATLRTCSVNCQASG